MLLKVRSRPTELGCMKTRLLSRWLVIIPAIAWLSCGVVETKPTIGDSAADLISPGPHDVAVLTIRDLGSIRFELFPELAPITVAHFTKLANKGFYDGTTFHRVIPGYMIQGGDPNSRDKDPRNDGKGGGTGIKSEFTAVSHERGIVSLAHRGNYDTGGSQFFIIHENTPSLDGNFSVFGRVIEGMDVVDTITEVEIDTFGRYGPEARPYPVDVVIESVRIESVGQASL